jgi:Zn-dependent protease with chaperone function
MSEHQTEHATEHESSHSAKHMLLMMLCCLLPIIAIVAITMLFPGASYLGFLFVLICPLGMLLMMLPNWLSKKKKAKESCH